MRNVRAIIGSALTGLFCSYAVAAPLTITKLTGETGGCPAATGVFRADLSGLGGSVPSISIQNNSGGVGDSPGQFSGFDLDAIVLSPTDCADAACAAGLAGPAASRRRNH
jgi:hypothetical protein